MDEKEEGEISLEDVSSSEDLNLNTHRNKKSRSHKIKMNDKRVEVDIRSQDGAYGKENRKCSNGYVGTEHKTLIKKEESKDGLTPISSDEDVETIRVPGGSQRLIIRTGQKKRRKKKKKKKTGPRMLTMDDLESDVVVGTALVDDRDLSLSQPRTYTANPVIYNDVREKITITTTNHQSRSHQSTRQHYRSPVKSSYRSSPDHSHSPSLRRRSPRKFLPSPKPSTSSSVPTKHCPHKTYLNKRHDEEYTSSLLKKVKEYDTTAVTPARQSRYKESSLKEKLNNMGKLHSDYKEVDIDNGNRDISNESIKIEDFDDDEEDIDTLRRRALDTQQSKHDDDEQQQQQQINNNNNNNNNRDNSAGSDNSQTIFFNSGDHNVEELQLRAHALKTAVMNKCKNKGLFIKKRDKAIKDESAYNDSLLNDVIENIEENSGYSPVHNNRGNDIADMELDSDVEREKINLQAFSPYSPTDEVGDTFTDSYLVSDSLDQNKNDNIDLEAPYSPSDIPATTKLSPVESYLPSSSDLTDYNRESSTPPTSVQFNNNSALNMDQQHKEPNKVIATFSVSNLSPLEQSNNCKNKRFGQFEYLTKPINPNETFIDSSVHEAHKKDVLYDEVIRDLEKDYGPICRDNKTNNKVNVNNKLVPAPILRINKHLQKSLPLKKLDNNNTVKVFKSAEMQAVDVNDKSAKTNTTFKPIKISQLAKKSLPSTSAEAFDSSVNDESNNKTNESTTISSEIISNASSNDAFKENESDITKKKSVTSKKPVKKMITNSRGNTGLGSTDAKNLTATSNKTKSFTDKNINNKHCEDISEDYKKEQTGKSNEILKQKKGNLSNKVSKVKNLKKPESLLSTNETNSTINDKKRRSSIEEEELRALALASLSKRLKQSGQQSDTTNELQQKNKVLLEKSNEITQTESKTTNKNLPVKNVLQNREKQSIGKTIMSSDNVISTLSGVKSVNNTNKRSIPIDCQDSPKKIIKISVKPTERAAESIQSIVDPKIQHKFIQNQKKKSSLLQESNAVKINDPNELLISKITSTKKIEPMVIKVGEDSDTDSESEQPTPATKSSKSLSLPGTDFQKKVEDFLRSQREKSESIASKSSTVTTNPSDFSKTPQAMRHLPPDKLEEYRRLKQRAAELEKSKTNDKRTRNSEKPIPVKSTEPITSTKNLPKRITKPGLEKTSASITAISNSISANASSLPTKSINSTVNTNNISNNNSESSSKSEENRLKVIANCSQEILRIIPRANKKTYSSFKANDNSNENLAEGIIDQNVDIKPFELTDNEITEPGNTTAINDSLEYINRFNDSITFEEQKVDPNIISTISKSPVIKFNSNVINQPTTSTENLSINNNFDKLVIQISNTRDIDVSPRRQVNIIKKDDDKKSEPINSQQKMASPFLRILTADQLNMRANQSSLPATIITTTTPMTTTSTTTTGIATKTITCNQQQNNVILNNDKISIFTCDNDNLIDEITVEEAKVDPNIEMTPEYSPSTSRTNNNNNDNNNPGNLLQNHRSTEASEINKIPDRVLSTQERPSEKINTEIKVAISNYKLLSPDEQRIKLTATEREFTEKKQIELDAYNLLTENLQELEVERQVQSDLSSQVKRLRAELKLAEERLKVQQEKLSGITSKIVKNKSIVDHRRIECINHARICTEMGLIVVGKEYRVPTIGNQLSRDAIKEVANHIKRLRKKKEGSVDSSNNHNDQQSNDDALSVSSKETGNTDDPCNLKTIIQLNKELVSVRTKNSTELLNSNVSQVNVLVNDKDSTGVRCQSNNDSVIIKTENVEINNRTKTISSNSSSAFETIINYNNDNNKNNNYKEIGVPIKEEIIDIELESLPVDSEFTISYPNLESELNQIEMNCITKNEVDKELDEFNEIESRLTPIDPTLPEESYPMAQSILQQNNINSFEPKTEKDIYTSTDTNLSLPVFSDTPPVGMSSLIRPTVQTPQVSTSSASNCNLECQDEEPLLNIESLTNRHKEDEKKMKPSQPVQSYESILPALNLTRNLDPNAVLCPFELKGTCKDDACKYAHLNHRSTL